MRFIRAVAAALIAGASVLAQPSSPTSADPPRPVAAQRHGPVLAVGMPAPAIPATDWVRGKPVDRPEAGRITVVAVLATMDPASRRSLPVLSEIGTVFRDAGVTVAGVWVPEPEGARGLAGFLDAQGAAVGFAAAYDGRGEVGWAWMEASGEDGVPTAFVVARDGRLAWVGHPLEGLDRAVASLAAGTYDVDAAAREAAARGEAERRSRPLTVRLEREFAAGDRDAALRTMDEIVAIDPARLGDWAVQKFAYLLLDLRRADAAYSYARTALESALKDHAAPLQAMSWMVLTEPKVEPRDTGLALALAERASRVSGGKDANVQDTLAKAQFLSGRVGEAVATQEGAVGLAVLPSHRAELRTRLESYRSARR